MLSFTFNRRLFLIAALVVACVNNALAAEGSRARSSQATKTPSFATVTAGVHKASGSRSRVSLRRPVIGIASDCGLGRGQAARLAGA